MAALQLRGGVIIIGSLLWEEDLDPKKRDNIRSNWREGCLRMSDKIMVKLPIRYGRWSGKREAYTMVFSANCARRNRLGTGFIVPMKRRIKATGELICQARMMAEAEGMNRCFRMNWALMSILLNPGLSSETQQAVLKTWEGVLTADGAGLDWTGYRVGAERPIIGQRGELRIRWPRSADPRNQARIDAIHFLIAASTKPSHECGCDRYPSIREIAESVRRDKERCYFRNNYRSGIKTYQDERVIKPLSRKG